MRRFNPSQRRPDLKLLLAGLAMHYPPFPLDKQPRTRQAVVGYCHWAIDDLVITIGRIHKARDSSL
jgi:hypothetical protein